MGVTVHRCPDCPRIELHVDRFVAHRADHADPEWVAARAGWLELARSNVAALNERRLNDDK